MLAVPISIQAVVMGTAPMIKVILRPNLLGKEILNINGCDLIFAIFIYMSHFSIIQVDGMAVMKNPTSIREIIQELSSKVIETGESGWKSFGIADEDQPSEKPQDITSMVTVRILNFYKLILRYF